MKSENALGHGYEVWAFAPATGCYGRDPGFHYALVASMLIRLTTNGAEHA